MITLGRKRKAELPAIAAASPPTEIAAGRCTALEEQIADVRASLAAANSDAESAMTAEDLAKARSQEDFLTVRLRALVGQRIDLEPDRLKEEAEIARNRYREVTEPFAKAVRRKVALEAELYEVEGALATLSGSKDDASRAKHAAEVMVRLQLSANTGDQQKWREHIAALRAQLEGFTQ